jgi:hypothetical protein
MPVRFTTLNLQCTLALAPFTVHTAGAHRVVLLLARGAHEESAPHQQGEGPKAVPARDAPAECNCSVDKGVVSLLHCVDCSGAASGSSCQH